MREKTYRCLAEDILEQDERLPGADAGFLSSKSVLSFPCLVWVDINQSEDTQLVLKQQPEETVIP